MSEEDNLRFTESISDFAALIQELGAASVLEAFRQFYPDQLMLLERSINKQREAAKVAALFKP